MKLDRLMLFVYLQHWDRWLDLCILEQLSSQFCTRSSCKSIVTYEILQILNYLVLSLCRGSDV